MVQLLVKINAEKELQEWAVVEIQGELESKSGLSIAGKFIGHLFYTLKGTPILIIGHHILYGKVTTIDSPFAVLKRTRTVIDQEMADNSQDKHSDPIDSGENTSTKASSTNYIVTAIVRKKILFKTRPKPIVATALKTKK